MVKEKMPLNLRVNPRALEARQHFPCRGHRPLKVGRRERHFGRSDWRFLVVENVIGIHQEGFVLV